MWLAKKLLLQNKGIVMNFIKIGCKFINLNQVTHICVHDDSVVVYFSSSDFNKESAGHPSLLFHGQEARILIDWFLGVSAHLAEKNK